jgi:hypothetical protein
VYVSAGSRCYYPFCWSCLADYRPIAKYGLHHHKGSCPNHRPERHHGTANEPIVLDFTLIFGGDAELEDGVRQVLFGERQPNRE